MLCIVIILTSFNSILVRLKVKARFLRRRRYFKFQFHIGAIKRRNLLLLKYLLRGFNSILVRLKGESGHALQTCLFRFQFHIGAIKSVWKFDRPCADLGFQFHIGAIKSCYQKQHRHECHSFNSILVRLKDIVRHIFCYF